MTSYDPIARFETWLADAKASGIKEPTAMCLATATPEGIPSARMVLLKEVGTHGFVFYTNLESRKGRELTANPHAALCFYWMALDRQVRVEGDIAQVSTEEADAYFNSRHRQSRIGAWASQQSRPMKDKSELVAEVAKYTAKFHIGEIPRPEYWSGFRLTPRAIEFWSEGAFRLHDRERFTREGETWRRERLYP